jgi:ABC-type transport system substrate-binding protein
LLKFWEDFEDASNDAFSPDFGYDEDDLMNRLLKAFLLLVLIPGFLAPGDVASVIPKNRQDVPRKGGVLRVRSYAREFIPEFDPAAAPHYFITEQLYDGLVTLDENFHIQPALAEYWDAPDSDKRTVFHLRKGVRFHHGRELTAEDVKFSLERLLQRRSGNRAHQYFIDKVVGAEAYRAGDAVEVSGFQVLDKHTFAVQWKKPFVSGLYLLGMYYCKILPKDLVLEQGRNFFQKPIGTGPFKFAQWLRSPRLDILGVRIERNDDYFGRKPYLDAIEYSPHFTEDQFEQGDVHITPPTSEGLLRLDRYIVLENTSLRSGYLVMSCHVPPLDDPEFRKALSLGIDRAALSATVYSPAQAPRVTLNYIPPVFPGFYPLGDAPVLNPGESKRRLDRLLAGSGRDGLTLTLCFLLPRRAQYSAFQRELQGQLDALGIGLSVRYLRAEEDIAGVRGPYLKFLEWEMDFPDAENVMIPLFRSDSPVNALNCRYASERIDGLLDQSEVEQSWMKRTELFRKMEKILFEEVPAIPLYNLNLRISLLPNVRGAKLPALGFLFLDTKKIWLEG